jgi:hypothetical protein
MDKYQTFSANFLAKNTYSFENGFQDFSGVLEENLELLEEAEQGIGGEG